MRMSEEGRRRKKEAMDRVEAAANAMWKVAALAAALQAALEMAWLTIDDVHERIPGTVRTHELRALGPVMLYAAAQGWIKKAKIPSVECIRPSRHSAPLTVWESLLYRGPLLLNKDKT
jgi:hypothetical protein